MGDVKVELLHGDLIAKGLRAAPAQMKRELRRSNQLVAKQAATWTRTEAASATPQQARMAKGIGWSSNSTQAIMTVRPTASAPGALGAFYGSKRYPQFPRWVGNSWTPAVAGQGPYVINPALARHAGDIDAIYLDGQAQAIVRAFPR